MRLGVLPFPVGAAFGDLRESWRAAEEAGFDALWTVDHATPTADLRPSWEASSLLVAMAAETQAIPVGVLVFDALLRHPFLVAGSVAVAQALSGGRVRVGLGVGDRFSRLDHEALGIPFPPFAERVRILDACCAVLPALWRGDTVSEPSLGLDQAALGPLTIAPPPLIVAGGSRSVMEVAARQAEGWNLYTHDPEDFRKHVAVLTGIEADAGRRQPLARSVYCFADRIAGDPVETLGDFARAGAEEAMLVVLKPTRESILELARRLLRGRRRRS